MKAVNRAVIYVVRDIERAMGKEPCADYQIIAASTPYSEEIRAKYPDFVFTVNAKNGDVAPLDTYELLTNETAVERILSIAKNAKSSTDQNNVAILVFKNNPRIERAIAEIATKAKDVAEKIDIKLANPSAELADKIEGKISQVKWLDESGKSPSLLELLPPHKICKAKEINWQIFNGQPFVVQWNHGHSGSGTIFIEKEAGIAKNISADLAEREARVTKKINGVMYTTNGIVFGESALVCHTSLQITGMLPFTDSIATTVGNDWALPHDFLSEKSQARISEICKSVGEKMASSGWKGLFGIDVIVEDGTEEIFLIEINARQTANISYESILQKHFAVQGAPGITTWEAHLKALVNEDVETSLPELIAINDGAQIIQRITEKFAAAQKAGRQIDVLAIKNLGFNVIEYANAEKGADALRIQSTQGIMERPNVFNARGKEILAAVSEIYPL